ncbi:hypothetical protein LSCM4_02618 [Leishmania orientalis]|uniref:Uncharacterized protein n=1 Tax=Leishmania orientalis TaxID=2249476 RepID=A0A836KFU5_9TRYP|nr:hypothetical protein LSCM4_02618 [Leishmania orientalis]
MFSAAVTNTVAAAVGQFRPVKHVARYGVAASGGLCMIRPRKSSVCDKNCAIILGCVLSGCVLIAFFIFMWCCLAAKRRREQRRRLKGVACLKGHLSIAEEEVGINEGSATVPASATVERDILPSFLSANAYSPASPLASWSPKSGISYPLKNVSAADSSGSAGAVERELSTRSPIAEDQVLPLSQKQLNPLAPQIEATQSNDAQQEGGKPQATKPNRKPRLRRKNLIRGVSAAACPEDSATSIEDHLV